MARTARQRLAANTRPVDVTLRDGTRLRIRPILPTDRGKLVTVPILARDEVYNEYKRAQEWRQKSADRFTPVLMDWLPKSVTAVSYFQKMFIPYVTHWSFGESLPVIENETVKPPDRRTRRR